LFLYVYEVDTRVQFVCVLQKRNYTVRFILKFHNSYDVIVQLI